MDFLTSLLARNGYLPHGYCFTWSPGLLWSMVGADAAIAASYFSIPLAIGSLVRQRPQAAGNPVAWLFCAFIFACGVTHLMDIWTVWNPDYGLQAFTKLATAGISIATALALWPLIPKVLKLPTVKQLQTVIDSLQAEVRRRVTVEEHLADTQQNLAATLASIGGGFIATDRAGRVTGMNAVAERVTGWTRDQALGRSLPEVLTSEDRHAALPFLDPVGALLAQRDGADMSFCLHAVARDGTRAALEVSAALTRAAGGAVRGAVVVFRDVTRINDFEIERQRLVAIIESSDDAIISKTLDGRITSWNRAAQVMFGYRPDEAVGRSVLMLIPPGRESEELGVLKQIAAGERVAPFSTVRRRKDGTLLDASVTVSPVRDATGRIVGASKIVRDVTSQRLAEEARRLARQLEAENLQIQESSRMKSQFLANMSHELRTPLNAIIGFADLLHTGTVATDSPQHREFLGHIGTSGRHLLRLINDVLDLSKVESGSFQFHPEPLDLAQVVKEVGDVLLPGIREKDLTLEVDIDADVQALQLDPARLKQVLFNYLSNAIKFTPAHGRMTVRARAEDAAHFRIEVEDTGIGIAAADLPHLFVDFRQLDSGYSKKHSGTGLGLALTLRLVQAQGGSVGVRSTPGQGSVFHLVLNRVHGTDTPRSATGSARVFALPGHRLLVIEDDLQAQARLIQFLSDAGYQVDVAGTAEAALLHAGSKPIDAITLDLMLQDRGALGLLAGIRGQDTAPDAPVVAMTLPAAAGATAGFAIANVLSKPIRSDEIVAALARLQWPQSRPARIMVIDDDPMALDLMGATLDGLGITALCLTDARAALRDIERHQPDAIILDLMMPEFDGFAVLDALSRMPAWRDVPVFVWTSMLLTDEEYATLARSARAILSKGGGALGMMLESLLRRRPAPAGSAP